MASHWGKSAIKEGVSSMFRGNPKLFLKIVACCDGDETKARERISEYLHECKLARHAPSVSELADNLETIQRARSPGPKNGARKNGLHGPLAAGTREQFLQDAARRRHA
jgi:hypothetical protein